MVVRKLGGYAIFLAFGVAVAQEPVEEFIPDQDVEAVPAADQAQFGNNEAFNAVNNGGASLENSMSPAQVEQLMLKQELQKISVDTFGQALAAQGKVAASEMQAKIRQNLGGSASAAAGLGVEALPENAMPLLNAKQSFKADEPTLEAIWGMEGREVAEVNYRGVRYSVSMQSPRVSEDADWYLKKIMPFHIVLEKRKGKRVVQTKDIPLNWNSNVGAVFKANHLTGDGGESSPSSSAGNK